MYYGKYRAIVKDISDPLNMGRIKVICPSIYDESLSPWCLPCFPSKFFSLPKLNDFVWIEFEEGNSQYPIWVGHCPQENKMPVKDETLLLTTTKGKIELKEDKLTIKGDVSIEGELKVSKTVKALNI